MASNKILVKAFIRQLFGSPDVHMFELSTDSSFEELLQEVSTLVGGRSVTLTWVDADGDHIRLSTDKQLKFAVTHGVKDNVLRVSVRVDWLGPDASARERLPEQLTNEGEVTATPEGLAGDALAEAEDLATAEAKPKTEPSRGKAHYSGYVRTVGADGVARERNLTEEEAAYLLHRSHAFDFGHHHHHRSPFAALGRSGLSHPHIDFQHPFRSPLYLGW